MSLIIMAQDEAATLNSMPLFDWPSFHTHVDQPVQAERRPSCTATQQIENDQQGYRHAY